VGIAWTDEEIAGLRKVVASGVLSIAYDGPPRRQVTYQSLASARELLASMIKARDEAKGTGVNYRRVQFSKGFGGRGRR